MDSHRTVLVTGSAHWVKALEGPLASAGFAVSASEHHNRLPELGALPAPGSVRCYVQAPIDVAIGATTAMGRLRQALGREFLTRFDAVEAIRPALRPDATVVLVADDRHDGEGTPDDPHARFDLLRVLAEAIRVDNPAMRVVVAGPRSSSDDIVAVAADHRRGESPTLTSYASHDPDLDYADWKEEVLHLATLDDWERSLRPVPTPVRYLGWTRPDGTTAVVVLRGRVVTPLTLESAGASWGRADPSAVPLARILLYDALRPHPDGGCDQPPPCAACVATEEAVDVLVEAFVDEILSSLHPREFVLSGHTVQAWARPRLQ